MAVRADLALHGRMPDDGRHHRHRAASVTAGLQSWSTENPQMFRRGLAPSPKLMIMQPLASEAMAACVLPPVCWVQLGVHQVDK